MAISDGDRHDAYLRRAKPPVLDVEEMLAMLNRRAPFIAGVTLACAGLSLAYVLLSTPTYVASGRILLGPPGGQIVGADTTPREVNASGIEPQIKAITSRAVLDKVMAREKLEGDPLFGARPKGALSALLLRAGLVSSDPQASALRQLERVVSVTRDPASSTLNVNAATSDRDASARIANAVMDAYLQAAAPTRADSASRPTSSSDASLEAIQTRLRDAEQSYQKYRQDNGLIGAGGQQTIEKQVGELSGQAAAAETRVASLRSSLTQIQRARDDRDFDAIPRAMRSSTFESLRNRYVVTRRIEADLSDTLGPRHPDLRYARSQMTEARRLLDQSVGDMVQSATVELERARSGLTRLKARLDASKKELANSSATSIRLRELERSVEESRAAYQSVLLRSRDVVEPQRIEVFYPQIVSRATPPAERRGASPARVLFVSILLGLGLAISLAWLLELMNERARDATAR